MIKDKNAILLDVLFFHFNFFDNEFIIKFLLYYKNKVPISTINIKQCISEKYKILKGIFFNRSKMYERSDIDIYLFEACLIGNKYMIKYLIEHGADVNKGEMKGKTLLSWVLSLCANESIVKYLIEHGADVNKGGITPLFTACQGRNESIV